MSLPVIPSPRAWRVAIAAPFAACALWSLLVRPELRSLIAPLLGPWAGYLFGHRECTLATVSASASVACAGIGALAIVAYACVRSRRARAPLSAVLALWSCTWAGAAVLSVLNTTS